MASYKMGAVKQRGNNTFSVLSPYLSRSSDKELNNVYRKFRNPVTCGNWILKCLPEMQKKRHVLTPSPYKSISVTWLITETFLCSRDSQRNVCSGHRRWPAVTRQSFAGRFLLLFYINKKANAAHREEVLYEGKWWEHVRGTVTQNRACQWQKEMRRSKSSFFLMGRHGHLR